MINTMKEIPSFSLDELVEVEKWVNELGVNFSNSRFGNSKRIYEKWHKTNLVPSHEELWCLSELLDLVGLYRQFSPQLIDKHFMSEIVSGSNFLADENKTRARDLQFELKIASRFKQAGFKVVDQNEHDVAVDIGDATLYVECKRFKNYEKMSERLKYAFENQLNKIEDRKEFGVVALDFSRVLYRQFIESNPQPVSNEKVLVEWRDSHDKMIKEMLETRHYEIISNIRMCIIFYSFPVIIEGKGLKKLNHFAIFSRNHSQDWIWERLNASVGKITPGSSVKF